MTADPPAAVPPAPRAVGWRPALGTRAWLLWTGVALIAAAAAWLLAAGASPLSALAEDRDTPATAPVGLLLLPGIAGVGLWFRAVLRTRLLLAEGRAAGADVLFQQAVVWSVPPRVLVAFRYRAEDGSEHQRRQIVRRAAPEGRCAYAGGRGLLVVHDPERPERCRLVAARRFVQARDRC